MDKVKLYLELARKHHFWVLCGLSAVAGLMAWYLASGKLTAQFRQNSSTIDSTFSNLKNVSPDQPHGDWKDGINKETGAIGQDVWNAWKALYQEQKDKVFVWPKDLNSDFLDAANQLVSDPKAVIPRRLCEYYQSMVKEQVTNLPTIVGAASLEDMAAGGGFNAAAGGPEHHVDWLQSSQQDIMQSFDWTVRPSTLLVKYAQEELWVYQALCNVIKAANEGSSAQHDAVVQEIDAMDIAYNAVEDTPGGAGQNHVELLAGMSGSGGAAPAAVGAPGGAANPRPDPKTRGKPEAGLRGFAFGPGAGGDAAAAPANPDDMWKNYRYVNLDGTPKTAADVDADAGEYNLMPFHLLLKMDRRYIDQLLVAFRNSILPIEVQQVRINPEHVSSSSTGSARFSAPGRGMEGEHGAMGPGAGRFSAPAAVNQVSQQHDRTVTVELRGVVYLLKPPDPQKLHVAPATETPASDTAAAGNVQASVVGAAIKKVSDQPAAANAQAAAATSPPAAAGEGSAAVPSTPATTPAPSTPATTPAPSTPTPTPAPATATETPAAAAAESQPPAAAQPPTSEAKP
jgi:hypothetical protein